ncbi:MAG TPA: hypothetical protein VNZ64_16920 [Candidatus Acidoferrum sp.]|jgi:hypothetical protein|nr:hypothetical protein [Candidatus Acidoferrum sp.]
MTWRRTWNVIRHRESVARIDYDYDEENKDDYSLYSALFFDMVWVA